MPSAATKSIKSPGTEKKLLRSHFLRLRRQRPTATNRRDSARILKTLKKLSNSLQATKIHCFLGQQEEPDTLDFLDWLLNCEKEVSIPFIDPGNPEIRHSQLTQLDDLKPGSYGILELPLEKRIEVEPKNFDLVLIPGIAFDLCGGRLGYGKGYYDRFLKTTKAFRVGVCFSSQIVESVPMEKHDIHMEGLVCETGWRRIFDDGLRG